MLKCHHCQADYDLPDKVKDAILADRKDKLLAAPCCGKKLLVKGRMTYSVLVPFTGRAEDDWGTPFTQKAPD